MAARLKHVAGDAGGHELKPAAATTIQTAARGHVGRCDVQTMRRTFVRVRAAKRMGVSIERLCGLRRPKARGVLEMRWTMIRSTTLATFTLEEGERERIAKLKGDAQARIAAEAGDGEEVGEMYSTKNLRHRAALQSSPLLHEVIGMMWSMEGLASDDADAALKDRHEGLLSKERYVAFNGRLHHALCEACLLYTSPSPRDRG